MIFLPIDKLKCGMLLAKDLRIYDAEFCNSVLLKAGTRLTDVFINRLALLGIAGAYIDDGKNNDIAMQEMLNEQIKVEAITSVKKLYSDFKVSSDKNMLKSVRSVEKTAKKMVTELLINKQFMVNIFDLKMYDDYTYHHSLSVGVLSLAMGITMNLSDRELYELVLAGMLHDVGKVAIPIEIINKPQRLTASEYDIIKTHPSNAGDYFLQKCLIPYNTYYGIVSHHEKYDGTGYPQGLKGDDIPLFGRILAVADVYDALTSNRPYRKPNLPSEAIEYIMGGIGTLFDEKIVRVFLKRVSPYPVGIKVLLSNGEAAVVIKNNIDQPLRPVVRTDDNKTIDLSDNDKYINVVISGLGY